MTHLAADDYGKPKSTKNIQYLYNVGPTSKTLGRHCINIIQIFYICLDVLCYYILDMKGCI